MKKLKKFYQDNEKTIIFVAGGIVGSFSAAYFANQELMKVALTDANLYKIADTGQMFLRVQLSNGTTRDYLWRAAEVAA